MKGLKVVILQIIAIFLLTACDSDFRKNKQEESRKISFTLDMETVTASKKLFAVTPYRDTLYFSGSQYLTKNNAFSGKNAILLTPQREFALSVKLPVKKNDCYTFTINAYGRTSKLFFVAANSKANFYIKGSTLIDSSTSGWKTLFFRLKIPNQFNDSVIKFYMWNHGKDSVYLDDLVMQPCKKLTDVITQNDRLLKIYLDKKALNKIEKVKIRAEKNGVITTDKKSWFETFMFYGSDVYDVKMRIKGDWLDHISGKKKSYRIKILNDKAFKRMKVFSIQKPSTRYFIHQWFVYTWFRAEDILSPRYDFVPVQENYQILGYYAVEEYFEKQLLESLKRREGPILKFSEDALWDKIIKFNKTGKDYRYPFYEASRILPFDKKRILKNGVLYDEFKIARNLLYQYKYNLAPFSDLFDVDKAAKFFALINIAQAWHGVQWHNLRFYYNPILCKLEYVNYDDFIDNGVYKDFNDKPIWGIFDTYDFSHSSPAEIITRSPFTDSSFVDAYIKYLEQFSNNKYLDSIFALFDSSINYYYGKLKYEYPEAYFDKNFYYNQARRIKTVLPTYKKLVLLNVYDSLKLPESTYDLYSHETDTFLLKSYVKAYIQHKWRDSVKIRVENYFPAKIFITGYVKKKKVRKLDVKKEVLPYYTGRSFTEFTIEESKIKKLTATYNDFTTNVEVLPWAAPTAWSPRQELENNNTFPASPYYSVVNDTVYFEGKKTVKSIVLIPDGYVVVFKKGAYFDFIDGGGFISYSPVFINGTREKPVHIVSTDRKANGFTILQAKAAHIKHAIFDGLGTLSYKGWQLSGAVTIYETPTYIDSSVFRNNVCEDDLNIVRSKFIVTNSAFINTFSDAFDSDFCTGITSNCIFRNLGNDAIDFSTSEIKIENCKIFNASDKGISGGEASKLTVSNCFINGANIAVASKDLSELHIDKCNISNASYGFAAFQKKPEYGPAKIIARDVEIKDVLFDNIVEKNSLLILNGKTIHGTSKNVARYFY